MTPDYPTEAYLKNLLKHPKIRNIQQTTRNNTPTTKKQGPELKGFSIFYTLLHLYELILSCQKGNWAPRSYNASLFPTGLPEVPVQLGSLPKQLAHSPQKPI
jgi:hypothetical protein